MAITRERVEEMLADIRRQAEMNNCNVDVEEVLDADTLYEAYYMGRHEQLLSIIEELDNDGGEAMFERVTGFPATDLIVEGEGH